MTVDLPPGISVSGADTSWRRPTAHHSVGLLAPSDLDAVVAWHLEAFPAGFYAQLGARFMRAWIADHMASSASVSLMASDQAGALVGYLLGTVDDDAYHVRTARRDVRLLAHGAAALAARPALWGDFARRRAGSYARRGVRRALGLNRDRHDRTGSGELVYICVDNGHRRRGAGAALLEAFTGEALRNGTRRLHLVTERDNTGAQRFYTNHGWRRLTDTTQTLDGRVLVRMERALTPALPCSD